MGFHKSTLVANNNNNNNNNNFIVQFIEWKYILHFGGCIKTQYLSHVVTHVEALEALIHN